MTRSNLYTINQYFVNILFHSSDWITHLDTTPSPHTISFTHLLPRSTPNHPSIGYSPSSSVFLSFPSSILAPSLSQICLISTSAVPKQVVPPGDGVMLKMMPLPGLILPSPITSFL
eukprot:GHVN01013648.1.p2 GENE.GHVN01013648.1~~GHVN01013648.1.p2  ORF type:complete len:116 (+),score=25.76 GHVN01013648.1:45-392(+)